MHPTHNLVLIVDDDAIVRETISEMLESNGYQTVMAERMETALFLDPSVNYLTVIIDVFMPGMGGVEGIAQLHEKWPDVKIIAISGGWEDMNEQETALALERAWRVGADFVLAKPFMEKDLIKALTKIEEHRVGSCTS